jgi:ABC-type bacteriocin/lantibiotic exporter with double-glycine peptidase domain
MMMRFTPPLPPPMPPYRRQGESQEEYMVRFNEWEEREAQELAERINESQKERDMLDRNIFAVQCLLVLIVVGFAAVVFYFAPVAFIIVVLSIAVFWHGTQALYDWLKYKGKI